MNAPTRSLSYRLFLLAASGLVPLALMLLVVTLYLTGDRRATTERAAVDFSRALANSIDAELRSTIALLQNLAEGEDLGATAPGALAGSDFAKSAAALADRQRWRLIEVSDARGAVVLRSRAVPADAPQTVEPDSLAETLRTGKPVVGRLARGAPGVEAFAVRVPVFHGNELRYVLSAVLPSDAMLEVMARQQVNPSWLSGVFDQQGFRIARSRVNAAPRYSPMLEKMVQAGGTEGTGITSTVEGVESYTGFSRVRTSRWVVATSIPTAVARADLYRVLLAVGAGTAVSLVLLAWLAWRAARGISGPIDELKRAASEIGAGHRVRLPPLGAREFDDLAAALERAAQQLDEAHARRGKVEAEREDLLARVELALRVADEANRNKDEFLALLGHELRNPLAPITNAVHLMALKGDVATASERQVIQRQLNYMTRLVDDLLDTACISSNRLVVNLHALQPVRMLEQTLESVRPLLAGRTLEVAIDPAARALWVLADEARLVQVFNNLLGNAIKFSGPGGMLRVEVRVEGDCIEFLIGDDGVGMTPQQLERAFDIFYQAPNPARGVQGGLGLGLAIVKSLVDMHAGEVEAASNGLDRGTMIRFRLPRVEAPVDAPSVPSHRVAHSSMRVMVVDDNQDAAQTLAAILELSGFTVQAFFAPPQAIEAFEGFRPQVAVLDIGLPGMDGYELARCLRALAGGAECKLIALTGYGQEDDVKRALEAGFDAHMTKPADPDLLLGMLAKFGA